MAKSIEEKEIIKKCIAICKTNNKENAIRLIEKEYEGCSVVIDMLYSKCGGMKMFMGLMLYKHFDISF